MADQKDIGALWAKTSKKGTSFLSGYINIDGRKVEVVCFFNQHKKESKHPDYKVYLSEPREQRAQAEPEDNTATHEAQDGAPKGNVTGYGVDDVAF